MFSSDSNWHGELSLTDFLLVGYTAYQGFLKSGRGVVFCNINTIDLSFAPFFDWRGDNFSKHEIINFHFVTQSGLTPYLNEWIIVPSIGLILQVVDTYNPRKDIILLTKHSSEFEVNFWQNLGITPLECYQHVREK